MLMPQSSLSCLEKLRGLCFQDRSGACESNCGWTAASLDVELRASISLELECRLSGRMVAWIGQLAS